MGTYRWTAHTLRRKLSLLAVTAIAMLAAGASPAGAETLWDQYDHEFAGGVISQDFDTGHNELDAFAWDDFEVPSSEKWKVKQVNVDGAYEGTGFPTAVNVSFAKGKQRPEVAVSGANIVLADFSSPDFVIPLDPAVRLRAGKRYWVMVTAIETFAAGRWLWTARTVTSGFPSMWINPFGGFGIPQCTSLAERAATCGLQEPAPDQVFKLRGKVIPVAP